MKIPYLKRVVLAGGVSWLALCGPAFATLQEALDALKEQDYIFAMEEFTRLADKEENAEARYYIGRMYEQGTGVQQDELKALEFYQQAADQGSASAALKVGNAYYNGKGKEKDYKEAFKWYKKAADLMNGTAIRSALVSTNSVSQGESVANLWRQNLTAYYFSISNLVSWTHKRQSRNRLKQQH